MTAQTEQVTPRPGALTRENKPDMLDLTLCHPEVIDALIEWADQRGCDWTRGPTSDTYPVPWYVLTPRDLQVAAFEAVSVSD